MVLWTPFIGWFWVRRKAMAPGCLVFVRCLHVSLSLAHSAPLCLSFPQRYPGQFACLSVCLSVCLPVCQSACLRVPSLRIDRSAVYDVTYSPNLLPPLCAVDAPRTRPLPIDSLAPLAQSRLSFASPVSPSDSVNAGAPGRGGAGTACWGKGRFAGRQGGIRGPSGPCEGRAAAGNNSRKGDGITLHGTARYDAERRSMIRLSMVLHGSHHSMT